MAQSVVDFFELVNIKEDGCHGYALSARPSHHLAETVEYEGTIRQSGKRIMKCQIVELIGAAVYQNDRSRSTRAKHEDK